MLDLITIGDIKLDTFVVLNDASLQCQLRERDCLLCLEYGAKIVVDVTDTQVAGTAPNVAVGLARCGRKTAVLSNMGNDATHETAIRFLKKHKVATRLVRSVPSDRSAYSVVLNFRGEKTLLTSHVRRAYRLPKPMPASRWVYVSEMGPGYESLYRQVATLAKGGKTRLVLNPGTIQINERKPPLLALLKKTDALFVNVEEAQKVAGEQTEDVRRLAATLHGLGPNVVVITDGKKGAYGSDGTSLHACPIFPGRLVESTGAGDAFSAGCLAALMEGLSLPDALRWGAVNSASVVGYVGPTKGLLSAEEIKRRLRRRAGFKASEMPAA